MGLQPKTLQACELCRFVHDDNLAVWLSREAYKEITGIDPITCRLSFIVCPDCYDYCFLGYHVA